MIPRRTPLKRSTKPIARSSTPIARSQKPLNRSPITKKPTLRKKLIDSLMASAKDNFFAKFGNGQGIAFCQKCCDYMKRNRCAAHHKLKRSLGGGHNPENLVIIHHWCHALIHNSTSLYEQVRDSPANSTNGQAID